MRKVVLFIATSLDGYIADVNRSVAWLNGDGSDPTNTGSYDKFFNSIDTVVLGKTTYEQVTTELAPGNWPYATKKSFVLTNEDWESDEHDITFTNKTPEKLISDIRENSGKDIWICGGAYVANEMLKAGQVDILHLSIIPTILGDGIKLFEKYEKSTKLKLISTENYNGIVDVVYEIIK